MIKHYLLSLVLIISIINASEAQTPYWMQQATGAGNDEVTDIITFQNEYYITGYYSNPTLFGSTLLPSQQDGEAFVAKINQNGEYVWARKIGGPFTDRGIAISVMPNGNVIATGHFIGSVDVGNLTISSNGTGQDIFVICFDPLGNALWFKQFGGQGIDVVSDIQADKANNIILTGQFIGKLNLGNETLQSGINPVTGVSTYDIFIAKLNSNGDVLWSRQAKSDKNNRSGKIGIGSDNSIFVSGNFTDTLTLINTYQNNSLNIGFIVRFDTAGDVLWFRRVQSSVTEIMDIACNDSLLYMTGSYVGIQRFTNDETTNTSTWQNVPSDSSTFKYYVAAYDYSGKIKFSMSEGSDSYAKPRAIRTLSNGGFVLSGEFKCQHSRYKAAFGSGLYLSRGMKDIFIAEFNSNHSLIRAKQIGGVGDDEINSMVINSYGKPVIAGSFTNSISSPAKNNWGNKPWYFVFNTNEGPDKNNTGGPLLNYCNDPQYNFYAVLKSQGSKDLLIANIADATRSTMDVFKRQTGSCNFSPTNGSLTLFHPDSNICRNQQVRVNVPTANINTNGIDYRFYWNNNAGPNPFQPSESGMVMLRAEALNTCYGFNDSILVEIPPPVPLASITATGGHIEKTTSAYILYANADSVIRLQGNDPGPSFDFEWLFPDTTIHTVNPIIVDQSLLGKYTYRIYDPVRGCSKTFSVIVKKFEPQKIIAGCSNPARYRLKVGDRVLQDGDTLTGCEDDVLTLTFVDISVDSMGVPGDIPTSAYWFGTNTNISIDSLASEYIHRKRITLKSDELNEGEVSIKIHFTFGSPNNVIFEFSGQYHVKINPKPVFNYNLSGSLSGTCPGDTARFKLETAHNYSLDLNSTNMVESIDPKIFYTLYPQNYLLTLYDTTEHGCIAEEVKAFSMAYYQAPKIKLQPKHGIICNNEPVILSIPGASNLVWVGPTGDTLSTQLTYSTTIPGLYYALVTGENNCRLISNTINIRTENSSFGWELTPKRICPGQTAEVHLYTLEGDSITWLPPFSGNDLFKTIDQPGTYRFTAPVCTVIDTFEVFVAGPEFTAKIIMNEDSLICPGDTIKLKSLYANDVSITWLPEVSYDEEFLVMGGGDYILELIDEYTCTTYDTVRIYDQLIPQYSIFSSDSDLCATETVRFWLNADSSIAERSWSYSTEQVYQDTLSIESDAIFSQQLVLQYHAVLENGCGIQLFDTIQRGLRPPDPYFLDSLVACSGDIVLLTLPDYQTALWFIGSSQVTPNPENAYQFHSYVDHPAITVFNSDVNGVCPSKKITIPVFVKQRIDIPNIAGAALCPDVPRIFSFNPDLYNAGFFYWKNMFTDSIMLTNVNQITIPPVPGKYGLFAFPTESGCGQDSTIFNISVQKLPILSVVPFPNNTICLNNGTLYKSTTSAEVTNSKLYINDNSTLASSCFNCVNHEFLLSHTTANNLHIGQNTLRTVVYTIGGCYIEHNDTIEVISPPTPNFTIDNYLVCVGDTVFIEAPVPGHYDWVELNSFSYLTNPYYGLPTTFEVYGTDTNSINYIVNSLNPTLFINSGDPVSLCRSDFFEIPIIVKPTMDLPVFGDRGICENDSLLIAFSPREELIGYYKWTLPNGSSSFDTSFAVQGTSLEDMGQYRLVAHPSELSCGIDSAEFSLTSYKIPLVEFVIDSFHVCTSRNWKILANVTGEAQINWNWDGNSSQANPLMINYQSPSEDSLLISGVFTNPQGCIVNKSAKIAVYLTPETPDFTVPATICAKDTVFLTLNNSLLPTQQFHFQSNVSFVENGNQLYHKWEIPDSAIHVVSFINTEHCVSDTLKNSFLVHQLPVFNLGNDSLPFCLGVGTMLDGPSGYSSYQWSTGDNIEDIQISKSGAYSLLVTDDHGCLFADTILVLGDWPFFQLGSDTITFCIGDRVQSIAPTGFNLYQWNTGSTLNMIDITETGEYILVITDLNGCTYSDSVFAQGGHCKVRDQPNVFSPNADGFNDKFTIDPFGMSSFRMVIYDRWGKYLAEIGSNDGGWDGKDQYGKEMPEGAYFFIATVSYINKSTEEIKGMIQLMK